LEVDMGEPIVTKEIPMRKVETQDDLEQRIHENEWQLIVQGTQKAIDTLWKSRKSSWVVLARYGGQMSNEWTKWYYTGGYKPRIYVYMLRRCECDNSERNKTRSIFIYSAWRKITKDDAIWRRTTVVAHWNESQLQALGRVKEALTPFGLDTEEYPDPASKDLEQFHHEYTALQIVEVVQMWRELETPSATEHQVHADSTIVHLLGMKVTIAT
jgi:hypothetical protein